MKKRNEKIIPCTRCGCKENKDGKIIQAIIRTCYVCDSCFDIVRSDNKRLVQEGKEIPQSALTEEDRRNVFLGKSI